MANERPNDGLMNFNVDSSSSKILRSFNFGLKRKVQTIQERTFCDCFFDSCSCNSECDCNPQCRCNPQCSCDTECSYCFCVTDPRENPPCTCEKYCGCDDYSPCVCVTSPY